MILITGASGHLGKATARFLREKYPNPPVAALVRDAEKGAELAALGVEVRIGDYNEYASLLSAFQGVDKLFFVSSNDIVNRIAQQTNVVNAAKEAGVKHILYTSFQRKTEDASSPIGIVAAAHIDTEQKILGSGLRYTILKNSLYMDIMPWFFGDSVAAGSVFLPAGNGKVAFVLREELAEASAHILAGDGHANKIYEMAGSTSESLYEVAEHLTEITGKIVTYENPSTETFLQVSAQAGLDPQATGLFAAFSEGIKQGEFDFPDPLMENLLGRKPVTIKQYLAGVYAQ